MIFLIFNFHFLCLLVAPQSGPFFPPNPAFDSSNAINIRRHLYSPSQLPQGLTEGQLAMLLQKGSQYQQIKHEPTVPTQPQLFPTAQVSQVDRFQKNLNSVF